jgi:polysaccharide export outer membrane protein
MRLAWRLIGVMALALPLSLAAQGAAPPSVVGAGPASYALRPGDILKVDVWGNEDFSGQFIVDETGRLQYPVLGEIDARNVTLGELRERLRAGLEQIFKSPFVTVTPLFRMAVLGEVRNPGLYTVDPTLSVLDVVAMAGGPAPNGNMNKIRLLRGTETLSLAFREGRSLQDMGVRSGDQIFVPRRRFTRDDLNLLLQIASLGLTIAIFVNTAGQ